jgi:DNA-binding protein Fis
VLTKTSEHKARAAKILGLDRWMLYRKVAQMDLRTPASGADPQDDS